MTDIETMKKMLPEATNRCAINIIYYLYKEKLISIDKISAMTGIYKKDIREALHHYQRKLA